MRGSKSSDDFPAVESEPLLEKAAGDEEEGGGGGGGQGRIHVAMGEGSASIASSVFNVSNNILGAGLLTMPYAFHRASTIPAILLLILMGVVCGYTFLLLCRCSQMSGLNTYKAIGVHVFGPKVGIFCEVMVCLMTIGSCISYNILVGDFIPEVAHYFLEQGGTSSAGHTFLTWMTERRLVIGVQSVLILLPLCSFKSLDSLRFTSTVGVMCIIFCSCLVIAFCFRSTEPQAVRDTAELFHLTPGLFVTCALMSVAFTMHYNALQFWTELKGRSEKRALKTITISFSMCWFLYAAVGLAGYYTFGATVVGDVLKSYQNPDYGLLIECSRLSLAVCVVVTYPLPFFACRAALYKVFWGGTDYSNTLRFMLVTISLIAFTVIIALFAQDVSVVLSFKGSLLGTPIVMILPALFYMRLAPGPMLCRAKLAPLLVLVFGVCASILGAIVTIIDVATASSDPVG